MWGGLFGECVFIRWWSMEMISADMKEIIRINSEWSIEMDVHQVHHVQMNLDKMKWQQWIWSMFRDVELECFVDKQNNWRLCFWGKTFIVDGLELYRHHWNVRVIIWTQIINDKRVCSLTRGRISMMLNIDSNFDKNVSWEQQECSEYLHQWRQSHHSFIHEMGIFNNKWFIE